MFYVICYDITNDRRRTKIAKVLEGHGLRVQKSVFECVLNEKEYKSLQEKLAKLLHNKEDTMRFYPLPEGARAKVLTLGIQPDYSVDDPAFIV